MRRAARIDSNQIAIVEALRKAGASVTVTSQLGGGFPDLVVGYRFRNALMEIKDGDKPPSQQKLTPDEEKWHDEWKGTSHIVRDVNEALEVLWSGNP